MDNLGLTKTLVELEQESEIRDLEQQAKGAINICNKALENLTIPEMSTLRAECFKAGITALAYAIESEAKQLRKQAKQIKEHKGDE